jgi:hypothetical protein
MSTILYVGAVGRSGTTLLERAVATSPSFVSLGEVVHLWERGLRLNEQCGCGEPFRSCSFWTAVGQRAFGGWDELNLAQVQRWQHEADRNRYIPMLIVPRLGRGSFVLARTEFRSVLDRLYGAIDAEVGADRVLIDASKHPSYLFMLRRLGDHDTRLLHVVRDPRGVAHSWAKVVKRPESTGDDMERLGPWRAAARWTSHNLLFRLATRLGIRTERMRYEQFAADPRVLAATVSDLTKDLRLTMPNFDSRTIQLGVNHTVSGNPMRFKVGPLDIRDDDSWRAAMPRTSRLIVSLLTLPVRGVIR